MNRTTKPLLVPTSRVRLAGPLLTVCSVAFLARVICAAYIVSHYAPSKIYGGFESCRIAASIATGHGFSSPYGVPTGPTAWLPPVYPYLVAAVFKLFGVYSVSSIVCLFGVNLICATLTTALLFQVGLVCGGPTVAFAGSMLWALNLQAILFSARLWESSLSALLVTITMMLYLRLLKSPANLHDWILYGLLWAFAALTNTALMALMPLPVAALLYYGRRQAWRPAGVALVVFLCGLAPWTIRNYAEFHKLIPIRVNFGPELWYGNQPGVRDPADLSHDPMENFREFLVYRQMGETRYAASRQKMALASIRQRPGEFLQLTRMRVVYFWTGSESFGLGWQTCIWLLAFLGLVLMCRNAVPVAAPFASALLLFPLPYYVTHANTFYRHPIEPLVGVLVAFACVTLSGLGASTYPFAKPPQEHSNGNPTQAAVGEN